MGGLLPPAEALASQLASLLRDSGGGPVLRAERVLADLLSLDYKGEALERIALRSPLVLPALAAALRTDDRHCLARGALVNGLQRPRMVAPVLEAAPSLIPELLGPSGLRGPLASAKLAASAVSRIACGCSGARAEVESWGALHALVDVAAAAARTSETLQRVEMALHALNGFITSVTDDALEGVCAHIAAAGAIPQIAAALAHPQAASDAEGPARMVEAALRLAYSLSLASRERAEWLACAGVLRPLVERGLRHPVDAVAPAAAKALFALVRLPGDDPPSDPPAAPPTIVRRLLECGALAALVVLLHRPILSHANDAYRWPPAVAAARALSSFAASGRCVPAAIAGEPGALEALAALLEPAEGGGSAALQAAAAASRYFAQALAADWQQAGVPLTRTICDAGAAPPLLKLLRRLPPTDCDTNNHDSIVKSCMSALFFIHRAGLLAPAERDEHVSALRRLYRPGAHASTAARAAEHLQCFDELA
jgi:hypothetical protein